MELQVSKECEYEGCFRQPVTGYLCEYHDQELALGYERYDLERLLKKHEPVMYERYLKKHGRAF